MIETNKYRRKPFDVDGVQVTTENIEEVAEWCGGEIIIEGEIKFIKVDVEQFINEKQTRAYVTNWVLFAGKGYKVYTDKAFKRSFELVPGAVGTALQEAQNKVTIAVG